MDTNTASLTESMPSPARRVINELLGDRVLSTDGLAWLICATDPFHDNATSVAGFPDLSADRSITQCVPLTTTIKAPPGTTDNWSAVVMFLPFSPNLPLGAGATGYSPAQFDGPGVVYGALASPMLYSGVNVLTGADNFDINTFAFSTTPAVSVPAEYTIGQHRLIGVGYEVVNTTSQLNKQGSVCTARVPCGMMEANLYYTDVRAKRATDPFPTRFSCGQMPPSTLDKLIRFPGSVVWEAAAGVYAVPTMNSKENPRVWPLPGAVALSPSLTVPYTTGSRAGWTNLPTDAAATYPYDITMSYFSGLSAETTLQVTARYYFERFPSVENEQLIVLTRLPTAYDPIALELYTRCLTKLPVAVQVGENPLGEWFKTVVSSLKSSIPRLLPLAGFGLGTALGGPAAGAAGAQVANALQSGLSNATRARRRGRQMANNYRPQNAVTAPPSQDAPRRTRARPPNHGKRKPQRNKQTKK